MCGIAGYISINKLSDEKISEFTKEVSASILHRGPDGFGVWNNENVFFLHRRLKIIDLDNRANQPFHSSDGKYIIIFNGEIYNFQQLKSEYLSDKIFKTSSDTEVLIMLFEKFGKDCVNYLNGIFAFAIVDLVRNKVSIFRDQYGVKPIYFYSNNECLIFASEIKALFSFGVQAQLNLDAVGEQLVYGYVAGKKTIYKDILRLLPGHLIEVTWNEGFIINYEEYFELTSNLSDSLTKLSDNEVLEGLKNAVKLQVISDVPVGFMCSGGIDSSAIAALATNIYDGEINTYCAKITQENFDESQYSQIVADHIKSNHTIVPSNPSDIARLLPSLIWAHDEPLKHPNSIPIYQVNKRAKKDVTVLLTGEGADEIFAGYWVFPIVRYLNLLRIILPTFIKNIFLKIFIKLGRQAKTIQAIMAANVPDLYVKISSSYDSNEVQGLMPGIKVNLDERIRIAEKSYYKSGNDVFQGFLYFYQQIHLVSLFDRQDKMSMINAIEGRVPFVDVNFVRIANSLPFRRKISGLTTKMVLRKMTTTILPQAIYNRPKYAFSLPINEWAKKSPEFKQMLMDVSTGYLVRNKIISKDYYEQMLDKFMNGNAGMGDIIWNIINLDLAARIFVEKENIVDFKEFEFRKEMN